MKKKSFSNRLLRIHRYYKITRFYLFLKKSTYKSFFMILIFVLLILGIDSFIIDINSLISNIVEKYPPSVVILSFLCSESILLGLIPPELFILWSSKSASPLLFLFALATASYIGGALSYLVGLQLSKIPNISKYIELKIGKYIINLRKWGGLFIVVGALSPIPHSIVSVGSGLIQYKFKYYLLWSLFRYLRFIIYYLVILKVL